ncbi:MAG: DUF4097 domain-containing protein [Clostridia bacterium]|nr:DUF4097 family beta strand repeat-containing protein [Clostridia bacterium]
MKNKGWIIAMIIFWIILIIFLIAFLSYVILNNTNIPIGIYNTSNNSEIICNENYDLEFINNIEILVSAGKLKIEENTDDKKVKVLVYGDQNRQIDVSVDNGKLKIDNTKSKRVVFSFNNHIDEITVYLPRNYNKEINVKSDYGNVDMIDLENATINIEESCGDINLGKVKNLQIDSDYGSIDVDTVLNKLDIEIDCGDLKIKNIELKENSKIKNDLGDVKIGNTNDIYIDANVDLGEYKINKNNRYAESTLKIDVNCGDIKVEN